MENNRDELGDVDDMGDEHGDSMSLAPSAPISAQYV